MLSDNLSPNNLRPIFSNALSLKLETIKLDAFIKSYSAGQTLPGKVIQVLPEQKAVVELQGEKLLLQFPRPVNSGQNIAIKIEQTQPNIILKLANISSLNSSQKITSGNLSNGRVLSNDLVSDKTSIQNRSTDSIFGLPLSSKHVASDIKSGHGALEGKVDGFFSEADLKLLGIQVGQKKTAEVVRINDTETLRIRFNGNEVTVKHTPSQKIQSGDLVYIHAKQVPSGKFVLNVEQINVPSSTSGSSLELSVLKNYLTARQSFTQVLTGLKEAFLDSTLAQLKGLNLDLEPLKQLQDNLQKIVSKDFKAPDAIQLKEMIDRSGFHYESRVKDLMLEPTISNKNIIFESDLKSQLMRIARQLEQLQIGATESSGSDKFIAKMLSQVNQAVSNIELQQLVHHFSKEDQHPLLLQLPENLLGEEDQFKIYVLPDQKNGEGFEADFQNRVFNLIFLLNLSAFGDLKIETKMFKDDISIQITGSNSSAVQFIQAHVSELEDVFQKEGFSINVTSEYQSEVSMGFPDSLGQLLIDTPLQIVDLKT